MNNKNLKDSFQAKIEKIKRFFIRANNPEPDRDWFAIFLIFIIIFFIISIWNVVLYFLYSPGETSLQPTVSTSNNNVDGEKLSAVLNVYEGRKKTTENIKQNPPVFADPSI